MKIRIDLLKPYLYFILLYVIINISNRVSIIAVQNKLAIIIAVLWMFVTIALYFLYMRKNNNTNIIILYSLSNAIIGGIAISSYYSLKNVVPYPTIALVFVFSGIMVINFCLINVVKRKILFTKINIVMTIILMISSICLWIEDYQSLGSSLVFLTVIYLCFSIALHQVVKRSLDWSSIIPISSLLMFGGLLLVVIIAITEGDGLEVLDLDFDFPGDKKKKSISK